MNILFLNQYGPDDPSPTAKLLRDLVDHFSVAGHTVRVASASVDYRQRPARGLRRWWRELAGLLRIFQRGLFTRPRPDLVISFTSPPMLSVFAVLVARYHGARSIHWALDLYPDLALALGELPAGPVADGIAALTHWAYRNTDTVVTLDEDMRDRLRQWGVDAEIITPWTPARERVTVEAVPATTPFWLYSGNLGRAHEWETLLQIQKLVENQDATLELIIQGGGAAWPHAQPWAERNGLQRCRWRDYAAEADLLPGLLAARVLVATERSEVKGMLWPSKLAVLLKIPRPILWVGPTDSAAARAVREHPGSATFEPGETAQATAWLLDTVRQQEKTPPTNRFDFHPDRDAALEKWMQLIRATRGV